MSARERRSVDYSVYPDAVECASVFFILEVIAPHVEAMSGSSVMLCMKELLGSVLSMSVEASKDLIAMNTYASYSLSSLSQCTLSSRLHFHRC